jgi:hypothetical protein
MTNSEGYGQSKRLMGKSLIIIGSIMLVIGIISFGILLAGWITTPENAYISGIDMYPSVPEYRTIFPSEEYLRVEFNVEPLHVPFKIQIMHEENKVIFDETFSGQLKGILVVSTGTKYDIMIENIGTEIAYVFGSIENENNSSEPPIGNRILATLIIVGVVGIFVLIIGITICPKDFQSKNVKTSWIGICLALVFIGSLVIPYVNSMNECLEIKKNYEKDPEIAIEKYRYETFEEWLIAGAPGNFGTNCVPIINLPENLFV